MSECVRCGTEILSGQSATSTTHLITTDCTNGLRKRLARSERIVEAAEAYVDAPEGTGSDEYDVLRAACGAAEAEGDIWTDIYQDEDKAEVKKARIPMPGKMMSCDVCRDQAVAEILGLQEEILGLQKELTELQAEVGGGQVAYWQDRAGRAEDACEDWKAIAKSRAAQVADLRDRLYLIAHAGGE